MVSKPSIHVYNLDRVIKNGLPLRLLKIPDLQKFLFGNSATKIQVWQHPQKIIYLCYMSFESASVA